MGKVLSLSLLCAAAATGCIDETEPQSSTATLDQVSSAPGIFDNFVSALNSTQAGQFVYDPAKQNPFDFGLSSFFLVRDIMGHDIATRGTSATLVPTAPPLPSASSPGLVTTLGSRAATRC